MGEMSMVMSRLGWASFLLGVGLWGGLFANQPTSQHAYYDQRERIMATMTLEWSIVSQVMVSIEWIKQINAMKMGRAESMGAPFELVNLIDEKISEKNF